VELIRFHNWTNLTGLNCLLLTEVSRILANEALNHRMDAVSSPCEPVLIGRLKVTYPEAIEESGVHLIDLVLCRGIDTCHHSGTFMETVTVQLAVQNDLERSLHNLRGRTVQLIEEKNGGLLTRASGLHGARVFFQKF
jgi:hypothetical protein